MAYNPYYGYPAPQFFPQPAPDQLSQLRQNQLQQMVQQPQPGPSVPQNGPIWVQGEEGAKAYMVAPGGSVMLMDSENTVFYLKSSDQSGMPLPLRIFDYTERTSNQPRQPPVPQFDPSQFITRDELENILAERLKKPARTAKPKEDTEHE